jgi:hypothetical protein
MAMINGKAARGGRPGTDFSSISLSCACTSTAQKPGEQRHASFTRTIISREFFLYDLGPEPPRRMVEEEQLHGRFRSD